MKKLSVRTLGLLVVIGIVLNNTAYVSDLIMGKGVITMGFLAWPLAGFGVAVSLFFLMALTNQIELNFLSIEAEAWQ